MPGRYAPTAHSRARFPAGRQTRIELVRELKRKGYSSREIGERVGVAPSTVRDYLLDPGRVKARRRQRELGVSGVTNPSGVYPVTGMKSRWKKGGPHRGKGETNAYVRGIQMRALIGYYSGRGR